MNLELGVRRFTIATQNWGDIRVLRPIPKDDDPWGVLAPLRSTGYGRLIPVVDGEAFSHALHGWAEPLKRQLGRDPAACLRLIPSEHGPCQDLKACIMANPDICRPVKKAPACYRPSGNLGVEEVGIAALVTLAWAEGRYVVVVGDGEFSL